MHATAVEVSQNTKTGPISTTYASQASCDEACPFLKNGCYAEAGYTGCTTHRLNKAEGDNSPEAIAAQEAEAIDSLTGRMDLRVHVVGDCKTNAAATIVAKAMRKHRRKKGKSAYTYTHAWRTVDRSAWLGESVLASCETTNEVKAAKERGYAAALVVEKFEREKVYEIDGVRVIPCPAQTSRELQCVDCQICMRADKLEKTGFTVAFEAHGTSKKKVVNTINKKKRLELQMA